MKTLTVKNYIQKVLFDVEICGQLSDGKWENTYPFNHWEPWSECEVVVGENVGRNFSARKDNYGLTSNDLLDVVGDRMVAQANMAENGIEVNMIREFAEYAPPGASSSYAQDKYWMELEAKMIKTFGSYEKLQETRKGSYDLNKVKKELREIKKAMKSYSVIKLVQI